MRGVLLVPSSSPTLPPIFDGLDANVTSNITWFHLNYDMASRQIYKPSFYEGTPLHKARLRAGGGFLPAWKAPERELDNDLDKKKLTS